MSLTVLHKTQIFEIPRKPASFEDQNDNTLLATFASFNHGQEPTIFSIVHDTTYEYSHKIKESKHLYRLQPVNDMTQSILSYELCSSSHGAFYNFTGAFGNNATVLDIKEPYQELKITSHAIVAVSEPNAPCKAIKEEKLMIPLIWMPWDRIMMQAYLLPPELPESELLALSDYAMDFVSRNNNKINSVLHDINTTIFKEYKYTPYSTTMATTPYEVYKSKKGVCQDFANLFICLARLLGVPARYRVGYLYTGGEYEHLGMHDQTHAWVEVFLPSLGWCGFDPTNGCMAGINHIRVACGRHYRDATPTSGVVFADIFTEKLHTSVRVIKLNKEST